MEKEETNKWTRQRSSLEQYGPDILMLVTALFFLALTVSLVGFLIIKPKVPGLSELFSDPPPPPRPRIEQKLNLAPGEQEIILFPSKRPTNPAANSPGNSKTPPGAAKPPAKTP